MDDSRKMNPQDRETDHPDNLDMIDLYKQFEGKESALVKWVIITQPNSATLANNLEYP